LIEGKGAQQIKETSGALTEVGEDTKILYIVPLERQ